ncbi:hypothetical protein, partial [Neoroseomonas lacus]|uniref:hypothetical protein n=1 Tax=Neoroseomonas lacus TaxID=287609 RepID=UPI001E483FDD
CDPAAQRTNTHRSTVTPPQKSEFLEVSNFRLSGLPGLQAERGDIFGWVCSTDAPIVAFSRPPRFEMER